MSLQAMLTARAMTDGHALRTAGLRHRRLLQDPMQIVCWQYGVEPFTIGALAAGPPADSYELHVPGFPINRDLLFWALEPFAHAFNAYFELPYELREEIVNGERTIERALSIPQLHVPNAATVALLGRLGRRLAYLPTDGDSAADPALVRLGRHLMFVERRAQHTGQQLIVAAADLMRSHWQTGMSAYEAASLAALDAWVEPPSGVHAFDAAAQAETVPVGPRPEHREGEAADKLVSEFNEARARSTDPQVFEPLLADLRDHYDHLIASTWELTARCIERERGWAETPSVERRFEVDRTEYTRHMEWMNGPAEGRRRARMTSRQAGQELHALEEAASRTGAEEAVDDPLRMIPLLLAGKALEGSVVRVDDDHREPVGEKQHRYRRPLVVVSCEERCLMPSGKKLFWTGEAAGREYLVQAVTDGPGPGSTITLICQTHLSKALPTAGDRACFSELNSGEGYQVHLPSDVPWTHRPQFEPEPTDLESTDELPAAA